MPGVKGGPEYDPDKTNFLLLQHSAQNTPFLLISRQDYSYMHQAGEIIQAMWAEVGFKVVHEIHPNRVLREKYRKGAIQAGEYDADSTASPYSADPDGWFYRSLLSSAPTAKLRSGYHNKRMDMLIQQARVTRDQKKRLELYTEVENIINEEVPLIYTHAVPLLQAGVQNL